MIPRKRRWRKRRLQSEFAFFPSLSSDYSNSLSSPNAIRNHVKVNPLELYPSSEREYRRRLLTSPIKRELRRFHVVVVQRRQKNELRKCATRAELLFRLLNLLLFLTFSLPSPLWQLKLAII